MTTTLLELEGTADEIAERLHGFAGRKLHVTVRPIEDDGAERQDAPMTGAVTPKKKGFIERLMEIQIDGPEDLSENFEQYANGEKRFDKVR